MGEGVRTSILISDTLYLPDTHCYKFSPRYSVRLPCYGFHKKSLRNLSKGRNSKSKKEEAIILICDTVPQPTIHCITIFQRVT